MRLKSKILGRIIYYITFLLQKSLRVQIVLEDPDHHFYQPYLYAFWHGKQFLPVWALSQYQTKRAALVSASKDGDILSVWLNLLGYEVIRGSSRHQNVSALAGMIKKLKLGYSLGFGVDGPIGPIYQIKPGMTHMAEKYGIAIIPVGSAFSRKWQVEKAWDKYQIPKPFAKAVLYIGKPFHIEKDADLESCNRKLECLIQEAEKKAKEVLM